MRQLIFTSLSFLLLTTNSTALASKAKISAKEFVAQAMNSNAQNTLSLIEHKGVSWFPKTQLRAERKGFDRKNNQTNSVGLRIYNSGLLSYSFKSKKK